MKKIYDEELFSNAKKVLELSCPELVYNLNQLDIVIPKLIDRVYDSFKVEKNLD